ncbi:exosome component 4 [Homo sapiens]|uniref:Exosome component 4 n=1 Tax=Homo sapiens TaxID=9606 RepID=E9PPI9_HUMAN|nr:exosome component 4 [Homo sapiens]KAI4012396.1 exosome component 4 [Homo sapiens]
MAGLELLSDQGYRVDGRRAGELRKIQARMGVFAQADGSAYIEQGNTKALAVVYGPHEIRGSRARALPDRALVNCQYSSATFSTGATGRWWDLCSLCECSHAGSAGCRDTHERLCVCVLSWLRGRHSPGGPQPCGGSSWWPPAGPGPAASLRTDCAA